MRKVVIHRAGGYDRLSIEEHPDPPPGPGEVRLAVDAIGVNYADCMVRMGLYASAREYVGWPITPGFEVAGAVETLGPGVTDVEPRSAVVAVTRFGGYATKIVVPASQVFRPPRGFTTEEAAGFPVVFLTASYALFELAHPRPGARILIHSAAGGVGGALVQLAKIAACDVTAVVGAPHKVEVALELGADRAIDKSRDDLWREAERHAPGGYDVVLDANGASTLRGSYAHLARGGKLVVYGFHSMIPKEGGRPDWLKLAVDWLRTPRFSPLRMTGENRSVLAFNLSHLFDRTELLREWMGRLVAWADEGRIRPPPVTTFPLDRVAEAHRVLESGETAGKLVLLPASPEAHAVRPRMI
ncbi:MAG: synaptic vesicle VAT-1 family membrane protein [Candidatus Binatia bacterium]